MEQSRPAFGDRRHTRNVRIRADKRNRPLNVPRGATAMDVIFNIGAIQQPSASAVSNRRESIAPVLAYGQGQHQRQILIRETVII